MLCSYWLPSLLCLICEVGAGVGRPPTVVSFDPFGVFGGAFLFVLFFIFLSAVFKLLYHRLEISILPESSLIIILGMMVGLFFYGIPGIVAVDFLDFPVDVFFFVLIPPILLEAGYFLSKTYFFSNTGTILLLAVAGTVFNSLFTGSLLFALSRMGSMRTTLGLAPAIAFGAAMNAVDPIAVVATFEEIHVNHTLNNIVFGESVINDGIAIVLFRLVIGVERIANVGTVFILIATFIVQVIVGVILGVLFGLFSTGLTRFTHKTSVLEPLFIIILALLSFTVAEVFHFSGDTAILIYGMTASYYAEKNLTFFSAITVKYLLKLLAYAAETIIFIFLGLSLFLGMPDLVFDFALIGWTLLLIQIARTFTVLTTRALVNHTRIHQISPRDAFILIYGGLRGAVSFALVFSMPLDEPARPALLATALTIILFTVFVQGTSIRPILVYLQIRRSRHVDKDMIAVHVFERGLDYTREGMEEVSGKKESFIPRIIKKLDIFIQKSLLKAPIAKDEKLVDAVDNLMYKEALATVSEKASPLTPKRRSAIEAERESERRQIRQQGRSPLISPREALPPSFVKKPLDRSRRRIPSEMTVPIPASPVTVSRFDRITDPDRTSRPHK
ncbi:hypothetical protein GEMRC1_012681 [Eukaryota sp. GEM-RC1]